MTNGSRNSIARLVVTALLLAAALSATGCQRQVEVQTGTRVMCEYGHVISDDVQTVKVAANEAAKYKVETVTRVCDRHTELEALYNEAQTALAAGKTVRAKATLTKIVATDATFRKAKEQLETINRGGKPAPDTTPNTPSTNSTTSPPSTGTTATVPNALSGWMPDAISEFSAKKALVDPLSVSREYLPTAGSNPAAALVVYAEQFLSPAAANAALASQIKSAYPKNAASIKVNSHSAYFGTDGRQYAVIGFTSGPVMVALEMTAKSGNPAALRSALEAAAKQLP